MKQFFMTIDGQKVTTDKTFGVINPATEDVFAQAPDCSRKQLDLAIEAANKALKNWRKDDSDRRRLLKACATVIRSHAEGLAELLTREQGRTFQDTKGEMMGSAWWIEKVANMEIPYNLLLDDESTRVEIRRKPIGVVGAITPWNFPILLAISKIAPALLVGNTMVLKPSPYTPLTTLRVGELLCDILPPGVLNIVSGGDQMGAWITNHPGIHKVTFTGSVETGKKVAQATAPSLTRAILELGGNDAAIVLPDVDPKQVANKLYHAAFGAVGQICIAIKRLYVHESIVVEMIDELKKLAENVKLGDGMDPDTDMGPINNLPQLERVIELTQDAKQHGAKIVTGGERVDRSGYFFPPTIVTNVTEGVRLVDEEQFGPVLPVISFTDIDEVIERANNTDYGLGGSVWTNDLVRGAEIAARLECGTAGVNQRVQFRPNIPFGGAKMSGIGLQNGPLGLDELCQLQVISIAK